MRRRWMRPPHHGSFPIILSDCIVRSGAHVQKMPGHARCAAIARNARVRQCACSARRLAGRAHVQKVSDHARKARAHFQAQQAAVRDAASGASQTSCRPARAAAAALIHADYGGMPACIAPRRAGSRALFPGRPVRPHRRGRRGTALRHVTARQSRRHARISRLSFDTLSSI